jgi:biopolymer transport protein ExbB/TolQ
MNFFNTAVNFFKDGGFFLYPLALIFVVGVSIAIERYVYLTRETMRNRSLWDALVPALGSGNFKQVVSLTQNSKASIATILNYGVARVASARRRDDIEKAMDESLLEVIPRIEKRTHYLSSLANVGLLIGLLGTITGLIGAFSAVAIGEPGGKGQPVVARDLGRNEQHGFRFGCRDHAAARAHVSRIQDHLADRQPRDRVGEILEFDHRASRRIGEFVDRAVDCAGRTCGCPQQRLNT